MFGGTVADGTSTPQPSPSKAKAPSRVGVGSVISSKGSRMTLAARGPGTATGTPGRSSTMSNLGTISAFKGKAAQSRVTPEVAARRLKVLDDADEAWGTVGSRLSLRHSFGSTVLPLDPVLAFTGPPNDASDKDFSERVIYCAGSHICMTDVDTGKQTFCARDRLVTRALHVCVDLSNTYASVCESLQQPGAVSEECQISVYKLAEGMVRVGSIRHNTTNPGTEFVCSVFCGESSTGNIAGLTSDPDRTVVVFSWQKNKIIRLLSLSVATTRLRSSPHTHLMLTVSGPAGGLKILYPMGQVSV